MKSHNHSKSRDDGKLSNQSLVQLADPKHWHKSTGAFFSKSHSRNPSLSKSLTGSRSKILNADNDDLRHVFSSKLASINQNNLAHHAFLKSDLGDRMAGVEKASELEVEFPGLLRPPPNRVKPRGRPA